MGELDNDFIDKVLQEEYEKQERKSIQKNTEMNENCNTDNLLPNHNFRIEFLPDTNKISAS
jgi:hypothetical protein